MQLLSIDPAPAVRAVPLAAGYEAFYEAEYTALTRLGYVLTGSRSVAEDLVQETMLRAYRHWGKVSAYDKPGAWARRVLCNLATSRGRKLTSEAKALVRMRGGRTTEPELRGESVELWQALRKLPARQAQTLALFYVEDLPVAEIATLLECPEGTVKALLSRGRAALAKELGDEEVPT